MTPVRPAAPVMGPANRANADRIREGRWLMIGEEHRLPHPPDWRINPSRDKEWQIAWHKHSFTCDLVHAFRETGDGAYLRLLGELLTSWLDTMGQGWITLSDAQVEAKRVESWIGMMTLLDRLDWAPHLDPASIARLETRLGEEARYIAANLKRERNHRTFQLASVFAVRVLHPSPPDAATLRDEARGLLTENLLRDLRDDGVQVEGSTHYHQLVTETALTFVELCDANRIPVDPALRARLRLALEFCAWFAWPDGEIPLINDADDGRHDHLIARGERLFGAPIRRDVPARDFATAGYAISTGPDQHLLVDFALLGDGSHAHYDLGSFTYWCAGGPTIVDPGRYTYSSEPDADGVDWRHRFKSTAAHSTIEIDGRDQTRYLNRTKRGPDAWVEDRRVDVAAASPWAAGRIRSHEYATEHERLVVHVRRSYLLIRDRLIASDDDEHLAVIRFHLAPGPRRCSVHCTVPLDAVVGWVSPLYGVRLEAPVLAGRLRFRGEATITSVVAPVGSGVTGLAEEAVMHTDGRRDALVPGGVMAGRLMLREEVP